MAIDLRFDSHARRRMAERGISGEEVRLAITLAEPVLQANGRYRFEAFVLNRMAAVIRTGDGLIVTAYLP